MFRQSQSFNQPLLSWTVVAQPEPQLVFCNAGAYQQPATMAQWYAAGYRG
jgi:hypothetical protein